ncbi:MAG: plasmid pRiA4b ORF-3 family protein [Bacteroidales bacterium]
MNTYQIRISLRGSKPKIWRRLLLPADLLLPDFHKVIQTAMGWENYHLHHFEKDRTFYTVKLKDDFSWGMMNNVNYRKTKISDLLNQEKEKIVYEYDFGDSWTHEILLEKILPYDDQYKKPACIAGKMNCPPEDCGGMWGYLEMVEILKQPDHAEYNNITDWLEDEFDPEYFDLEEVNNLLKLKNFGCA